MPEQLEKLDTWIRRRGEGIGRPEAIRRLLDLGLAAESAKPAAKPRSSRPAKK